MFLLHQNKWKGRVHYDVYDLMTLWRLKAGTKKVKVEEDYTEDTESTAFRLYQGEVKYSTTCT